MLKFLLFGLIGQKLDMDKEYWWVLNAYVVLWTIGKVMGWL